MSQHNGGHPRRWLILGVLMINLLVVVLDNTILNVALKVLADPVHGLGASQGDLQWSINSYTLVFSALLFSFGVLGDRHGRKRLLIGGLALFAIASVASAYATDPAQLIAARALMGLGGAAIMPVTLAIISNVFSAAERPKAIGIWSGAVGVGVAVGPILGGLLLEHYWWGSVFLINVPIVAVGIVAVSMLVPESRDPRPGRLDLVGVALSVLGLVSLVYGIIDGGDHGFGRLAPWAWTAGGVAILAIFVGWELRHPSPSLDVRLFTMPRFSAATAAIGLAFFGGMGVFFFMSFYLQLTRGLTPLRTGVLLLPFALGQLVFAPRTAALVRRFGARPVVAGGLALTTLSGLGLLIVDVDTPLWLVGVIFFVQGVGMAHIIPPAMESLMSALPRERSGIASAVSNTVRQISAALGVAVLGAIVAAIYRGRLDQAHLPLPAAARTAAGESLAAAHVVAEHAGTAGAALTRVADLGFVAGMHAAAWVSAGASLLALAVVLRWLPGRPASPVAAVDEPVPALAERR